MHIRELSVEQFNDFKNGKMSSYHQTNEYAQIKCEEGFEYELLGLEENGQIRAAFVFLVKLINGYLYAYIPDGPIINYKDAHLLDTFTLELIKYCKSEKISYVKINPNKTIGIKSNNKISYNEYNPIKETLEKIGYSYIKEKNDFEYILPDINAIIDLENLNFNSFSKNTKNKIRKSSRKGLSIEKGSNYQFDILNKFILNKRKKHDYYYNDYYNIFAKNDKAKIFLVKLDYERFITNTKKIYDKQIIKSEQLNNKLQKGNIKKVINYKMDIDKVLLSYKNDISFATKNYAQRPEDYIAGAITIEEDDTAYILISGYDKNYKSFSANYFLYYEIMKYYEGKKKYLHIGGISKELSGKYKGIDEFKLGFNPIVTISPGEFDLIINKRIYKKINKQK